MKLSLNRHLNDKFLSFLIINAIYVSVLKMNFLSSNILDLDHDFHVNLDISSKSSQILKKETVVGNLIHYNNLYLMNLANTGTMVLLLQTMTASKKPISL